jgi:hypothetical protein
MEVTTGYFILVTGSSFALGVGISILLTKLFSLSFIKQSSPSSSLRLLHPESKKRIVYKLRAPEEELLNRLDELYARIEGVISEEMRYAQSKDKSPPDPSRDSVPNLNYARREIGEARDAERGRLTYGRSLRKIDIKECLKMVNDALEWAQKTNEVTDRTWPKVVEMRYDLSDLYGRIEPTKSKKKV